jgi:hypothetical protein
MENPTAQTDVKTINRKQRKQLQQVERRIKMQQE